MEQINNSVKCCGTCSFWLGTRQPHRLGFIEVEKKTDSAKCSLLGLNESRKFQALHLCSNYVKWQAVR